jgi:transcriptional regulator with XRE-family HTH domain
MDQRLISYIRPLRRRWGLTQTELALLIGAKTGGVVSRIEAVKRFPTLAATFACELIFDTSSLELFPDLFAEVHKSLLLRTNELYIALQGNSDRATSDKLDFLEQVLARLDARRPPAV